MSPAVAATSTKCASKGFPDGAGLAWGFTERGATPCPSKWPADATADKVTNKRRVISMKKAFFEVPAKAHGSRRTNGNVYRPVFYPTPLVSPIPQGEIIRGNSRAGKQQLSSRSLNTQSFACFDIQSSTLECKTSRGS